MRVLITRPEPGASRTAERVAADGHEPMLLPLTTIDPLPAPVPPSAGLDALAVTSANALRKASEALLSAVRHLPCYAVGAETARIAADLGFARVRSAEGDACALAGLIGAELPPPARLLYVCGRLRRPTFEAKLAEAGFDVTPLETYETLPLDYTQHELQAHLGDEPIGAVLVHSAEAAIALVRLLQSDRRSSLGPRPLFVCMSPRVAAVLAGENLKTFVAAEPTEASMLSTLRDISSEKP